jgi:hypothetical protein
MSSLERILIVAASSGILFGCGGSDDVGPAPPPMVPPISPAPPAPPLPPPPPPTPQPQPVRLDFSFNATQEGWEAVYSDYALGQEQGIQFGHRIADLPAPLTPGRGYLLSSKNESDDVWMFIYREVTDLAPSRGYRIDISLRAATNGGRQCVGIGGSPGESVTIKAGGVSIRPETRIERGNYVTVNFDKGVQTVGSQNVPVIGDFTSNSPTCTNIAYETKSLMTPANGAVVTTDARGSLWLVVGTDSGFEGLTAIYYLSISAQLTPV